MKSPHHTHGRARLGAFGLLIALGFALHAFPLAAVAPASLPAAVSPAPIGGAGQASPTNDGNAALRYVSAAAHLATAPTELFNEIVAWAEGPASATLASRAVEFAVRQERPRLFLLLGDRQQSCTFTPDNQGVDLYEMPPCAALERLADTQVAAALHLPSINPASAADLLGATFTLGDRLARHGVLVSRMTGTRIRRLALLGMRRLLERPGIPPEAGTVLEQRLSPITPPRREVQDQVRLDSSYLLAMLAAGLSRPDLLVKFGFERHPAALALPSVLKRLEGGATPEELASTLVADPTWPTWTAGLEEYLTHAAAIDPLSQSAGNQYGILVSGPAMLENPLIGCLCWDFSWVHQKLDALERDLAATLDLARRTAANR